MKSYGWGRGIRTPEYRYQKPRPYRLAIPQHSKLNAYVDGIIAPNTAHVKCYEKKVGKSFLGEERIGIIQKRIPMYI